MTMSKRRASTTTTTNAFTVLMGNSSSSNSNNAKKKKRARGSTAFGGSSGSRFVLCPAGCGKHFEERFINLHLDTCVKKQEQKQQHHQQQQTKNNNVETVVVVVDGDSGDDDDDFTSTSPESELLSTQKNYVHEKRIEQEQQAQTARLLQDSSSSPTQKSLPSMTPTAEEQTAEHCCLQSVNEEKEQQPSSSDSDVLLVLSPGQGSPLPAMMAMEGEQSAESASPKCTIGEHKQQQQQNHNEVKSSSKDGSEDNRQPPSPLVTVAAPVPTEDPPVGSAHTTKGEQLQKMVSEINNDSPRGVTPTAESVPENSDGGKQRHPIMLTSEEEEKPAQYTSNCTSARDAAAPSSGAEQESQSPKLATKSKESSSADVFSRMMKQSKSVFSGSKNVPLQQCICLREDGTLGLNCQGNEPAEAPDKIEWSSTVQLRAGRTNRPGNNKGGGGEAPKRETTIELVVCSCLPRNNNNNNNIRQRFVRRHSRLSVPVLKSILQKSIRRRRPLPAVRVAMELADKSLGDLLRRLPIIILEDSSLHPDFGLLVWLMIAHSKNYILPQSLLTRVLEIVYEISSCQWSDPLDSLSGTTKEDLNQLSLSGLGKNLPNSIPESAQALVWSMLVRAEYGGMKCDTEMLLRYANLWVARFASGQVTDSVIAEINPPRGEMTTGKGGNASMALLWSEFPTYVHQRAKAQSFRRIALLSLDGIDQLTLEDVCIEGVDFHCSDILDHILSDYELVGLCHDLIVLSKNDEVVSGPLEEDRHSWLEGIMKSCMWSFSSGVNNRRPISKKQESPNSYMGLWDELLKNRVRKYQKTYIQQRLAWCQ